MENNKKIIYLDHASTSPPSIDVVKNIENFTMMFYNPSSVSNLSIYNKRVLENVRAKIAESINASPEEIIFTSGGSESNSLAIDGYMFANGATNFAASSICHSSILNNPNVEYLIHVDNDGFIDLDSIPDYIDVCCIDFVNNEIGTIQDVKKISEYVHKSGRILFVDAVQAFGKIDIDVKDMGIDMMSASAHKIGGISGVGFLYVKNGIKIDPIIYGTQENNVRGGTYNSVAIKCFGVAIDSLNENDRIVVKKRRDYLLDMLLNIDGVNLNGSYNERIYNNINIRIDNISINNQQIVSLLEMYGFIVSAGSACHSGDNEPCHVLKAIGLSDDEANSSIRITIGIDNSVQDLVDFADSLKNIINMNRK